MKKTFIFSFALLAFGTAGAQEVPGRYLSNNKIIDAKIIYFKNLNDFNKDFIGGHITYIKNILMLDGDGYNDPKIGVSLNPSAKFPARITAGKAPFYLMQDAMLNFIPSVYLTVQPDQGSKFNFFGSVGAGVRMFNKLSNLVDSSNTRIETKSGFFDQWVMESGFGIDYDKVFSLQFKYVSGWHGVSKSTASYYKSYIDPSGTTIRYFKIRANFNLSRHVNGIYSFVEWDGYRGSFDNQRMMQAGLGFQLKWVAEGAGTEKPGDRSASRHVRRIARLQNRVDEMRKDLDDIGAEGLTGLDDATLGFLAAEKKKLDDFHITARRLADDYRTVKSKRDLKRWLRRYKILRDGLVALRKTDRLSSINTAEKRGEKLRQKPAVLNKKIQKKAAKNEER